jgi:hypothetical protein
MSRPAIARHLARLGPAKSLVLAGCLLATLPARAQDPAPEVPGDDAEEALAEPPLVTEEFDAAEGAEEAAEEAGDITEAERVAGRESPSDKPWSVSANAGTSTSMAMFHPTPFVRSYGRSLSMSLGASGRYRLTDQIAATAGLGAAYHLVNPKDLSGRRFWLSDPSLGVSHSSLYRDERFTGLNVTGGASMTVGLSPSSRYNNRIGSLSANLGTGRAFLDSRLTLSASLNGGVVFSRYTSPIVRKESDDGLDMALARADGSELLAGRYNLVAGNAQLGSIGTNLSASFRAMDGLTANVSVGVSRSLRYCPPIDHLTSDAVDSSGDRIVRQGGVCRSDGMVGSFGASYNLGDGYSLSASFSSGQPIYAYRGTDLTEENRTLRFPWWDPDLHMTSFSLRASKSF